MPSLIESQGMTDRSETKQFRALVVDDEPLMVVIATTMLEVIGFKVDGVHCGVAALELLEGNQYGLVLTDYCMPQMNGLQLAKQVKLLAKDCKVVIMTGLSPSILQDEMTSVDVDRWLFKPVHLNTLKETVSALFSYQFQTQVGMRTFPEGKGNEPLNK